MSFSSPKELPVNNLDASIRRFLQRLQLPESTQPELTRLIQELVVISQITPSFIGALFLLLEHYRTEISLQKSPLTIGIQGGRASFNEVALNLFVDGHKLKHVHPEYLYTTAAVLAALDSSQIDLGVFAIANSLGGLVEETQNAVTSHDFDTVALTRLRIAHSLMKRPDQSIADLRLIMAHPQVIKQCATNLRHKYPELSQQSGTGELIDTARAAQALVAGEIEATTAILGNELIARSYGLEVIDRNLEDSTDNFTYFVLASSRF